MTDKEGRYISATFKNPENFIERHLLEGIDDELKGKFTWDKNLHTSRIVIYFFKKQNKFSLSIRTEEWRGEFLVTFNDYKILRSHVKFIMEKCYPPFTLTNFKPSEKADVPVMLSFEPDDIDDIFLLLSQEVISWKVISWKKEIDEETQVEFTNEELYCTIDVSDPGSIANAKNFLIETGSMTKPVRI